MNPLGFSKGWAELAFSVPPPLVPSSLIASWLANGPPGIDCVACSSVVAVLGTAQGLQGALAHEHHRDHHREREQDPHRAPHEVDPEVADRRRPSASQPSDQGDGDGEAHGGRHEVLHGQARHLREVAHRVLAGVVLPVRVGHEAHGRVERERLRHRADVGGVEGQRALEALERVDDQDRDGAEGEQRVGVGAPALLAVRVDPAQSVDGPLDLQEHPVAVGLLVVAEHAGEVGPEDPRADGDAGEEGEELEPGGTGHVRTSPGR